MAEPNNYLMSNSDQTAANMEPRSAGMHLSGSRPGSGNGQNYGSPNNEANYQQNPSNNSGKSSLLQ